MHVKRDLRKQKMSVKTGMHGLGPAVGSQKIERPFPGSFEPFSYPFVFDMEKSMDPCFKICSTRDQKKMKCYLLLMTNVKSLILKY